MLRKTAQTKSLILLLALSPLVGCNEYGIVEDPDNIGAIKDGLEPDILVTPISVDFGRVDATNSVTEVVSVQNVGEGDLHILDIQLTHLFVTPFYLILVMNRNLYIFNFNETEY